MNVSEASCVWARLRHVLLCLYSATRTQALLQGEATTATPVPAACFDSETVSTHTETRKRHSKYVVYRMPLCVYIRYHKVRVYTPIHDTSGGGRVGNRVVDIT